MNSEARDNTRRTFSTSLLLLLIALVSITAVTVAWFSIADNTRIYSMDMQVTTGASLRFDLDPHPEFQQYVATLSSEQIFARIQRERGFDPLKTPLTPVTTNDGQIFSLRNGTVQEPDSGAYLRYTLHFMSTEDMTVHLSSANSDDHQDGTLVNSSIAKLPSAMRISFTCRGITTIYDPGTTNTYKMGEKISVFGLPTAQHMLYNDENVLFSIQANTDTEVEVCIWMEGTDEACTDELKKGDYAIQLRFVGTDANNIPI